MDLFNVDTGVSDLSGDCMNELDSAFTRFCHLLKSRSEPELITSVRKILNAAGIGGFFVFELLYPASLLRCVGTLPESLVNDIGANSFQNSDLVLRHLLADPRSLAKPLFRSVVDEHVQAALYEPAVFKRHKQFVDHLKKFHIREIYYHPFLRPKDGGAAAFCLWGTGDVAAFRESVQKFAPLVLPLARAFYCMAGSKTLAKMRALQASAAPLEVLRLMVEKDLNMGEVARLTNKHEVTINKHVAAAKKAFGVATVSSLVAQSIKDGYIILDDIG